MIQQREAFIDVLFEAAKTDPRIMFLTADLGSPSLDAWRTELPAQFVHCGISEQNMVNVAVGLALAGKKPYIFAMSPFFLRAYEQLKMAAMHQVPITVISVGAGLSYAGSGPTHYATEDIACYRTLVNTDLYTVSTANLAKSIAKLSLASEKMMVVRLERGELPELYEEGYDPCKGYKPHDPGVYIPCVASGYLVHWLRAKGKHVIDLYRINPIPKMLMFEFSDYEYIEVWEEQYAPGGIGAAVIEAINDVGRKTRVSRKSLPNRPIYENGTRDELLKCLQ